MTRRIFQAAAHHRGEIVGRNARRQASRPVDPQSSAARVSWDEPAKQVSLPAVGRFPVGTAIEAAGNGVATVRVRLDGVSTAAA